MNKITVLFLVAFVSIASMATINASKGFKIETQFEYSNNDKSMTSKGEFILAENNKSWTTLTEPKNGVALLGRVAKSDKTGLRFEYIVVDTTKNNAVISTPMIITKMGQKAEVTMSTETEKIVISLLATPTEYSIKK